MNFWNLGSKLLSVVKIGFNFWEGTSVSLALRNLLWFVWTYAAPTFAGLQIVLRGGREPAGPGTKGIPHLPLTSCVTLGMAVTWASASSSVTRGQCLSMEIKPASAWRSGRPRSVRPAIWTSFPLLQDLKQVSGNFPKPEVSLHFQDAS